MSKAVFKKRFYFYLLKTDHVWCFNAVLKTEKGKGKTLRQSRTKHLETFSVFSTICQWPQLKQKYYHEKVNMRVAKRLRKFRENLWNAWVWFRVPSRQPLVKTCRKSAVKHSIDKPVLLNFVNMSPTFSPRFSEETYFHF